MKDMLEVECPACEHKFTVPVEVHVAAPVPRPRRWLRAALLLAGLAVAGACAWWVLAR